MNDFINKTTEADCSGLHISPSAESGATPSTAASPENEAVTEQIVPAGIYLDTVLGVSIQKRPDGETDLVIAHHFFDGVRCYQLDEMRQMKHGETIPRKGDTTLVLFAYDEDGYGDICVRNEALFNAIVAALDGARTNTD